MRLVLYLATGAIVLLACGLHSSDVQKLEPSTVISDDWLERFPTGDAASIRQMSSVIEFLLVENKFLFRVPTGEIDQALVDALKRFQEEHDFAATGRLSEDQFNLLVKGLGTIDADVALPPATIFSELSKIPGRRLGVVSNATWVLVEPSTEKLAAILNTSEIRCVETLHSCTEASGKILQVPGNQPMLDVDFIDWTITEWVAGVVTAEKEAFCVIERLRIDFSGHSARTETLPKPSGDPLCSDSLRRVKISELRDPFDVSWTYTQGRKEERLSVWSKEYRAQMNRVMGKHPPAQPKPAKSTTE